MHFYFLLFSIHKNVGKSEMSQIFYKHRVSPSVSCDWMSLYPISIAEVDAYENILRRDMSWRRTHTSPKYYASACLAMAVGTTRLVYPRFIYEERDCFSPWFGRRFRRGNLTTAISCWRTGRKHWDDCVAEEIVKIIHLRSCEPLYSLARHKPFPQASRLCARIRSDIITAIPSCII